MAYFNTNEHVVSLRLEFIRFEVSVVCWGQKMNQYAVEMLERRTVMLESKTEMLECTVGR